MAVNPTELAGIPIFGTLAPTELERLASGGDSVVVGPGVELTHQGDFGHSVFAVLEGSAQVVVDVDVVGHLASGDMFGEIAVISSGRRTATVISSTPMRLVGFFKRDIWELEKNNHEFADALRELRQAVDHDS